MLFVSYRRDDGPKVVAPGSDVMHPDVVVSCAPQERGRTSVDRLMHVVEVASRNADGAWTSRFVEGVDSVLDLPVLELNLPMRDLYEDVEPERAVAQNV